jgi:hypothetical protein
LKKLVDRKIIFTGAGVAKGSGAGGSGGDETGAACAGSAGDIGGVVGKETGAVAGGTYKCLIMNK